MSTLTIGSNTFDSQYRYPGTTAKLRLFYSTDFEGSGSESVHSRAVGSNGWYTEVSLTVAANTLSIPGFTLVCTDNSDQPNARVTGVVYDQSGARRETLFENWMVQSSLAPSCTYTAWRTANRARYPLNPPRQYLDRDEVIRIAQEIVSPLADEVVYGRVRLDVPAISSADPEVTGSNSPVIPAFVLHTSKYASLNAAKTALDSLGGGTIAVDSATPVASSVTIPATIGLRFEGQGMLTGSGKTVTIVGPFEAPEKRVFAAGVTAVFTGPTTILKPHWFGAIGGGVDQTAELQAAVDALPAKGVLLWPHNLEVLTTAPLRIWTRGELSFIRVSGTYYADALGGIKYEGPDDTQAVQIYNSYGILWEGIKVKINDGVNNGQQGIDIDMFPDATVIGGRAIVGQVTSNVTVRNCQVVNTVNSSADSAGFRLAFTSGNNCEMCRFETCEGSGGGPDPFNPANMNRGSSFQIGGGGGGTNAKNTVFDRCVWQMVTYGIKAAAGDFYVRDCEGQWASIDVFGGNPGTATLFNNRVENGRQFFVGRGVITMMANNLTAGALDAAFPVVKMEGPGLLTMIGDTLPDEVGITSVDNDPAHANKLILFGSANPARIAWSNFTGGAIHQGQSVNAEYLYGSGKAFHHLAISGEADAMIRVGLTGGLGMFQRQGWISSVLATWSANLKQSFGATTHDVNARSAWEVLTQLGVTAGGTGSEVRWNYYDPSSNTPVTLLKLLGEGAMFLKPVAFAALPASPLEGMIAAITDSNTVTWGAAIAGGGANNVLGFFDGANWTVMAK